MTLSTNASERAWVEVDLAALVENARTVAAAAGVPLLPLVKADGYGLGMLPVATALEAIDPWGFGVATPVEGETLRAAGCRRPIVVFTPTLPMWFDRCRAAALQPVLGSRAAVEAWLATGSGPFHLEIDTGMARSGLPWRSVEDAVPPGWMDDCAGVMTHFACADSDAEATAEQRRRFEHALARLPRRPAVVHAANSAAAFRGRDFAYDLVRPGIFLYGGRAGAHAPLPHPVASFRARVTHLATIEAGAGVSYGWRWRAPTDTRVATLAAGYADGVPRAVEGRGQVELGGERCAVVGSINMDMTLVEVGPVPVREGDVASFFGDTISLEEWAGWSGTIPYEVLTRIGQRVPRVYL